MTKKDCESYLIFKRHFSIKRTNSIYAINLIFTTIIAILFVNNDTTIYAIVMSLTFLALCMQYIRVIKKAITVSNSYYLASIALLNFYIILGSFFCLMFFGKNYLFEYILSFVVISSLMMLIFYKWMLYKLKIKRFPKTKYSEVTSIIIIALATLISIRVTYISVIFNGVFEILLIIAWIIFGSYTIVDCFVNYKISKKYNLS